MVRRALRVTLILVSPFIIGAWAGCGSPPPQAVSSTPAPAAGTMGDGEKPLPSGLLDSQTVVIQGRTIGLDVMLANMFLNGGHEPFICLSIEVDGRSISYFTNSGPYRATVVGNDIRYGGHVFTITPTAGNYVSDGAPIELRETGRVLHCFVDGKYSGIECF